MEDVRSTCWNSLSLQDSLKRQFSITIFFSQLYFSIFSALKDVGDATLYKSIHLTYLRI